MSESVYYKVEKLYKNNLNYFDQFEEVFESSFNIPKKYIKNSCKRVLVESFDNGRKSFLQKQSSFIKSFFLYYMVMFLFVLNSIFQKKEKEYNVDILIEEWAECGLWEKYYKDILALIDKRFIFKVFILNIKKCHTYKNSEKIYKYVKFNYNSDISKKIYAFL